MKSFVVRLYVAEADPSEARRTLRGIVEEIRNGRHAAFGDEGELLDFLAEAAEAHDDPPLKRSSR